jgi:hypothetical protein
MWEKSDRSRWFAAFDEDFPLTSFRKRTYHLSRSQASLMTQIRSGHIPLNGGGVLGELGLVDSVVASIR